ncbi:hypothetical protein HJC23_001173 [Cyclotella cryptica]|uniref:Ataxin-10 domain-containing protein n=1 Tax=Cyclotella cryptica TaxID=29204 RepID=A0ABD3QMX9_9STRA|eukprot:CCRYP_003801-RA/>CCRYP_003801-RA protein AED:0.22 eAED:0.22 QI:0/-1/0/1/-1/1/1/0/542
MADNVAKQLIAALHPANHSTDAQQPESDLRTKIAATLKQWNDSLENDLLRADPRTKSLGYDSSVSSPLLKEAANALHFSLVSTVDPSLCCEDGWTTDSEAGEASRRAANAVSESLLLNSHNLQYFSLLVELLRAAGLFMRWHGQVLQSPLLLSQPDLLNNPTVRFKSDGMLLMCSKLIENDIFAGNNFPDVPRFASIYLFRATYGNDSLTMTTRTLFVESMDGCSCLMKALLKGDQPLSRLFSVVRNIHHLVSSYPSSITKMDRAIDVLMTDTSLEHEAKQDLLQVLVATLAWAFRSEPIFPGDSSDRRSELMLEILRALFAMDVGLSTKAQNYQDNMTQLGIILCDLLKLSNSDARVYQCKLAVVALLLNAPKEYAQYLAIHGGIKPLVDIMEYQLSLVVVERTASGAEDAAAVVPILLVLKKLAQASSLVLKIVKDEVFPPDAEGMFQEKVKAEMIKNQTDGQVKAKNMAPLDAPKSTLRWKLIRLMTWTESTVKRSGSELLWTLCDDDPTKFVLRTGFGNAIHFLGMKGCVTLPNGIDI